MVREDTMSEEGGRMDRNRLIDTLKRHEGYSRRPYYDTVGKMTIGHGRNLDDKGITPNEARTLLLNDIQDAVDMLRGAYPQFDQLDSVRQEVLVNMAFNMGNKVMGFSKMLFALEIGEWEEAAKEMLDSRWAGQVKARATELAEVMRTGHWPE
jgi:lysozyme